MGLKVYGPTGWDFSQGFVPSNTLMHNGFNPASKKLRRL